jgi:hypothetical protein
MVGDLYPMRGGWYSRGEGPVPCEIIKAQQFPRHILGLFGNESFKVLPQER